MVSVACILASLGQVPSQPTCFKKLKDYGLWAMHVILSSFMYLIIYFLVADLKSMVLRISKENVLDLQKENLQLLMILFQYVHLMEQGIHSCLP